MSKIKIGIIGVGYVGLPLARLFATKYPVVGFDINRNRIKELKQGVDNTKEVESTLLKKVIVEKHETILMFGGGHGIEVSEDTKFIEIKQGPFDEKLDKEHF